MRVLELFTSSHLLIFKQNKINGGASKCPPMVQIKYLGSIVLFLIIPSLNMLSELPCEVNYEDRTAEVVKSLKGLFDDSKGGNS